MTVNHISILLTPHDAHFLDACCLRLDLEEPCPQLQLAHEGQEISAGKTYRPPSQHIMKIFSLFFFRLSQCALTGQIHYILPLYTTSRGPLEVRLVGKGKVAGVIGEGGGEGAGKTLPTKSISGHMLKTPSCWTCYLGHFQHSQQYIHAGSETAYRSGAGISIDQRNTGHKGLLNRVHP